MACRRPCQGFSSDDFSSKMYAGYVFFRSSLILELVITMSKFVSALTLAFIFLGTTAHAGITIVDGVGTSSGSATNTSSYAVNLPTGIADGDLVVVAIASNSRPTPS